MDLRAIGQGRNINMMAHTQLHVLYLPHMHNLQSQMVQYMLTAMETVFLTIEHFCCRVSNCRCMLSGGQFFQCEPYSRMARQPGLPYRCGQQL